jgi:hypothetical protein
MYFIALLSCFLRAAYIGSEIVPILKTTKKTPKKNISEGDRYILPETENF